VKQLDEANAADSRQMESTTGPDKLVHHRRVYELIGSSCKNGATARSLANRGLIRAVKINGRVIRYSEASVFALVAGRVA